MKEKIERYNKLILVLLFVGVNSLGFALITKSYLGNDLSIGWLNVGFLSLVLAIFFPVFILSFYFDLKSSLHAKRPSALAMLIFFVALITVVTNYVFEIIEVNNYPNYVYSVYQIYLPFLQELAGFQSTAIFLFVIFTLGRNVISRMPRINILTDGPIYFISMLLVVMTTHILLQLPAIVVSEIRNQFAVINSKLDFKDTMVDLSLFATQGVFVRDNTPKTAVILHPSQTWDFPELGNQVLLRYYTFPRTLVSPGKIDEFAKDFNDLECELYSVVAENQNRNAIFPNKNLEYEKLTFITFTGESVTVENGQLTEEFFALKDVLVGVAKHKTCKV